MHAFAALPALHVCAIVLDDARLPNLLLTDGKAFVVDLTAVLLDAARQPYL